MSQKEKLQEELELLFDKHQLFPRVRKAFRTNESFDFPAHLKKLGIPEKFGIDLLAQMAVRKRANLSTLVGVLRHHFKTAQACTDMLTKAAFHDLVNYSTRREQFIVVFTIDAELQRALDQFQYPLPLLVPPKKLEHNLDSGYFTRKESVLLQDNHHDGDVCLDHLNRINSIKLSLNMETAYAVKNKWKNIDKRKTDETWEKYQERLQAFRVYNAVSHGVMKILQEQGNELYLSHRYDKRGRTYCSGYHVNYMGNDWNKAVVELYDQEPLED